MKVIAGFIGGIIFASIGAMLVTMVTAASPKTGGAMGAIAFFVMYILGIIIALRSKSASKAWRKLLISSGVLSFLLPLSAIIFTGSIMTKTVDSSSEYAGAQAAGTAIGGGIVAGMMGFVGFFLGVVLLVIGLLVGRDKQVIYVQVPTSTNQ